MIIDVVLGLVNTSNVQYPYLFCSSLFPGPSWPLFARSASPRADKCRTPPLIGSSNPPCCGCRQKWDAGLLSRWSCAFVGRRPMNVVENLTIEVSNSRIFDWLSSFSILAKISDSLKQLPNR